MFFALGNSANAQTYTYFPNDATVNYQIPNSSRGNPTAVVGYANDADFNAAPRQNPTSPTVSFNNSNANNDYFVQSYNKSYVNMNGIFARAISYDTSTINCSGTLDFGVLAADNSTINFNGEFAFACLATNNGTINMSGGYAQICGTADNSTMNFSGGSTDSFEASDNGTVNVSGGNNVTGGYTNFLAENNSTLNVSGGNFLISSGAAQNNSTFNISGGTLAGDYNPGNDGGFDADDSSRVNVSGGSTYELTAYDSSIVTITGGYVGVLRLGGSSSSGGIGNSVVNYRGGMIGGIALNGGGTLNIFGTGLGDTLTSNSGGVSQYSLVGTLADGTSLSGTSIIVQNGSGGNFTLHNAGKTPAPSSVLVLLLGAAPLGVSLLRRRRE